MKLSCVPFFFFWQNSRNLPFFLFFFSNSLTGLFLLLILLLLLLLVSYFVFLLKIPRSKVPLKVEKYAWTGRGKRFANPAQSTRAYSFRRSTSASNRHSTSRCLNALIWPPNWVWHKHRYVGLHTTTLNDRRKWTLGILATHSVYIFLHVFGDRSQKYFISKKLFGLRKTLVNYLDRFTCQRQRNEKKTPILIVGLSFIINETLIVYYKCW